jgi:Protein kinase domain
MSPSTPAGHSSIAEAIAETMTASRDSVAVGGVLAPPRAGADRYETRREIGRGGMGRVVEAIDRQFGRVVAVKEVHAGLGGDGERRFVVEALVTGNLEHPGIPSVYERGVAGDGSPFYAMRRVQGRTLADAIAQAGSLAERLKLLPVVTRAAQAIAFAHDHGVIHRDIKPQNIIVGPYGETVVLDWGISKVRGLTRLASADGAPLSPLGGSVETAHGSVLGTPAYMAPEQAEGKLDLVDERTDVFALGALLYHLLAGHAPYRGTTSNEVLASAVAGRRAPLDSVAPEAPSQLRAVCEKALATAPGDRYPSATAMAAALEAVTADALARRESSAVRWFAGITSALAIAGLLIFSIVMWTQIASLREQGIQSYFYVTLALLGCATSVIEWFTRGRYRLGSLGIALSLATLFSGLASMSAGIGMSMSGLSEIAGNAELYRVLLARGVYEVSGGLSSTGVLASLQIVLWAVARRRARSERQLGV